MGNVIYNKDLLTLAHKKLIQLKLLNKNIDIPFDQMMPKQESFFLIKDTFLKKLFFALVKNHF